MNRFTALIYDRFLMGASQQAGLVERRREALASARGEVLDIAGPVGGYNLQAAFSTGVVAGMSAARDAEAP